MSICNHIPRPDYAFLPTWENYASKEQLEIEYRQSLEEGLAVEPYEKLFHAVAELPNGAAKHEFAQGLYRLISAAPMKTDYPYQEPSDLPGILAARVPAVSIPPVAAASLPDKLRGAWMGRICGCMLGKPIEGIRTPDLTTLLKLTENYPLSRYILRQDLTDDIAEQVSYPLKSRTWADEIHGMPPDDDTNYTVLSQVLVSRWGRDFTTQDVGQAWLQLQPKDAYCTAERVAFCNLVRGYTPPDTATYQNPYREWIGAQIRTDYYGYINPGHPDRAAEMAYRDAALSHVKNGIYGAMFAAAMVSAAASTEDPVQILKAGMGEIPTTSRLYQALTDILAKYESGADGAACMAYVHQRYDENNAHDWCHTIPNAMIVATALLYGRDYASTICMAVQAGFDTDCNGATVGSVYGMAHGITSIPPCWQSPMENIVHTTLFGLDSLSLDELVQKTLEQVQL